VSTGPVSTGPERASRGPVVHIAHDYITQRGGAERVVLSLLDAYPEAEVVTSIYSPESTFPQFRGRTVRKLWPSRIKAFRRDPRLAMPVLAPAFSLARAERGDIVICSSSGWAHGLNTTAAKVIYCHTPARWLYATEDYLPEVPKPMRLPARYLAFPLLRVWDRRAARKAAVYIANSTVVKERIRRAYGINATVIHPPVSIDVDGAQEPVPGVEPGYLLCVSRARGYKNVAAICQAVADSPGERLVVVGGVPDGAVGPEAADRIQGVSRLSDEQMRWIYSNAAALIAVSREDFGLTPLEAASFGVPTLALRAGGFLDTIDEAVNGRFFTEVSAGAVRAAVRQNRDAVWNADAIRGHAALFTEERFAARITEQLTLALA